ncbi:MAG: hypothetical protein SP1CHLAM54_05240 [Chlamydiia bacterium]|nr:hypothetical protein [Chlamydiia bacterium]MCH9615436.1 hypothetical protein [Chlamydiia bacterium]MCH9628242.1 hypothetical protein [Chlamydiia bacterium]
MLGIFLDTETNGLHFTEHRILEIAFKTLDLETGETMFEYEALVCQPNEVWERSTPRSLEVNGFTYEKMKQGKQEAEVREEIIALFKKQNIVRGKAVFICQNPSFDRSFFGQLIHIEEQEGLQWPYHWLDLASMFWAHCLSVHGTLPWEVGFSKNAIARHFNLDDEAMPHRAMNGVDHLIMCYDALLGFDSAAHPGHS